MKTRIEAIIPGRKNKKSILAPRLPSRVDDVWCNEAHGPSSDSLGYSDNTMRNGARGSEPTSDERARAIAPMVIWYNVALLSSATTQSVG